jgi:cyclase
MLRKRLITVLTFNQGVLFRTKLFTPDYRYTLNFVDAWSVDEIVVLDVTRDPADGGESFRQVIADFASRCFVPLAAGGGIRTLDDVRSYLDLGADKVVINSGAIERPSLITEIANRFGSQCAVLSIDAKKTSVDTAGGSPGASYEVYSHFGARPTGLDPSDWAKQGQELGAGEILIGSIDRDGSLQGYELPLCREVSDAVGIPVLVSGGAGNWDHFVQGFTEGGASGVCTANIYHFTESSIQSAKRHLDNAGIPVRI